MLTKIILVRHGESEGNKQEFVGQDPPLTDAGREQARATKAKLENFSFDEVYSSDLQRAAETAEIIIGQPVPTNHRLKTLRERYYGRLEGASKRHLHEEHKIRIQMTAEQNWTYKHVPDIENDQELAARFIAALKQVARENPGKTVLVAAHGAAIRTTLMKLKGMTYSEIPRDSFKNAGYVELEYSDGKFQVSRIVGHQI